MKEPTRTPSWFFLFNVAEYQTGHLMNESKKEMSGRRSLPVALYLGCGALLLIPVAQWIVNDIDRQYSNFATAALILIGTICFLIAIFRRTGWRGRSITMTSLVLMLIAFLVCFEFKGFTGEMLPTFAWRFSKSKPFPTINGDVARIAPASGLERLAESVSFTQFLGNDRTGNIRSLSSDTPISWMPHSQDSTASPPWKEIWRLQIGEGWGGVCIAEGKLWTLYQSGEEETLACIQLTTGKELWKQSFAGRHFEPVGGLGPRSTPTWYENQILVQTGTGRVVCLQANTGAMVWQQDLITKQFANQSESESYIKWGRSASPLVVPPMGDNQSETEDSRGKTLVVLPLGGKPDSGQPISLIALNIANGEEVWRGGNSQIAYASPALLELDGVNQIVNVHEGAVSGHDVATGRELWSEAWPSHSNADACASQPVLVGNNRVLLGKGYAAGSKLIELENPGDATSPWKVRVVWQNHRILKTKLTNAIFHDGKLYGLSDGALECIAPEDGKRIWRGARYGQGQLLVVDGKLLVTSEDGRLAIIDRENGKELQSQQVLDGICWNYPAVALPFVVMRNASEMVCLVAEASSGPAPTSELSKAPSSELGEDSELNRVSNQERKP